MINEMKDSNCEWTCENCGDCPLEAYDCRSCGCQTFCERVFYDMYNPESI